MAAAFTIDPGTGTIRIADAVALRPGHARSELGPLITDRLDGARDHGNGHEWLRLADLTFGGRPASLALGFGAGRLERVSWSIRPAGATSEGGWPTRAAIDAEVAFVRDTLSRRMGVRLGRTSWGEIWSRFDGRAFAASNGLRYHPASGLP